MDERGRQEAEAGRIYAEAGRVEGESARRRSEHTRERAEYRRERRGVAWLRAVLGFLFFLVIILLGFTAVQFVPANPYHVYESRMKPEVTCPHAPVEVILDQEIENTHPVRQVEVESHWEPGGELAGEGTPKNPGPFGRHERMSPVTRFAPASPGEYRLHTKSQVAYNFYGIPRFHVEVHTSSNTLRVTECEGE